MSKKDKKIEIQLSDAKVVVGKDNYDGYTLTIGKKLIGEIAELDNQFAIIKNGNERREAQLTSIKLSKDR